MRLALIVGSSYEKNGRLAAIPSAAVDCDLMERRLAEVDAGFKVMRFDAERGLAERIEQRLIAQGEPIAELLVYFSGYSVLSEDRGPALLLDGERLGTLSLTRLRNLFLIHASKSCLLVDAAAVVDAGQGLDEVVNSLGTTLVENAPSVSALVAVRNSTLSDSFGGSAFTGLLLMVLDWLTRQSERSQGVDLRAVYEGLRADPQLWKDVPAAGLFGQEEGMLAILAPESEAPTTLAAPPPTPAEEPLPSFATAGDLDELLGLASPRTEEAKTQPGLQRFEETDEVTPTRTHVGPSQEHDSAPLPSFDFVEATEPNRPATSLGAPPSDPTPLPSFDFVEATEPNRPLLASDAEATAAAPSSEPAPPPQPSEDEIALRVLESALSVAQEPRERGSVLAKLAQVLARLGKGEQAASAFAESVAVDPLNVDVLSVRAEWAEAAGDFKNLLHTSEAWLESAPHALRPLSLLARATEKLGDAKRAIEVNLRVSEHTDCSPEQRKRALANAARLARSELADFELAESIDARIKAPPQAQSEGASALSAPPVALSAPPVAAAPTVFDTKAVPEVAAVAPEPPHSEEPASGREVQRARVHEYERAISHNPADTTLRERLIELYSTLDDRTSALDHCRTAAQFAPMHPTTYRLAHSLFQAEGDPDGAWNAACVLECLGEADINESLMVSQHKPEGLLAARSTLSEREWAEALFASDRDVALGELLAALSPAAARVGTGFAKLKGRYTEPDASALQDPEKSTAMLAKTLTWTARMLGVEAPLLYVLPDLAVEMSVGALEQPSTLVSRSLGSGLGLGELAFLWGRHLPRFRDEVRALSYFSSAPELAELLRAALALGGARGLDVGALDGDAKRLYAALRRELRGPALERLQAVARGFVVGDLEARAFTELRRLELLGVRAGLAVSGDVCLAAELIQRFAASGITRVEEQLGELYAFAISQKYASLRQRMGVAVAA